MRAGLQLAGPKLAVDDPRALPQAGMNEAFGLGGLRIPKLAFCAAAIRDRPSLPGFVKNTFQRSLRTVTSETSFWIDDAPAGP